jgi:hypothetical protein
MLAWPRSKSKAGPGAGQYRVLRRRDFDALDVAANFMLRSGVTLLRGRLPPVSIALSWLV